MIYKLETIPMVLFSQIMESGDLKLLSDETYLEKVVNKLKKIKCRILFRKYEEIDLKEVWDNIREDFKKHDNTLKSRKIDSLRDDINKRTREYQLIIMALGVLNYGKNDEMIEVLKKKGYKIKGNFDEWLELVNRQVINLLNIIESKNKELEGYLKVDGNDINIYEVLVNLSVGLEIPLNANKITAIEYIFYSKALRNKIKALK